MPTNGRHTPHASHSPAAPRHKTLPTQPKSQKLQAQCTRHSAYTLRMRPNTAAQKPHCWRQAAATHAQPLHAKSCLQEGQRCRGGEYELPTARPPTQIASAAPPGPQLQAGMLSDKRAACWEEREAPAQGTSTECMRGTTAAAAGEGGESQGSTRDAAPLRQTSATPTGN